MYLFVGNLPADATADDLEALFARFGTVVRARVAIDRDTGLSRGFGFVELARGAGEAVQSLNGFRYKGRELIVAEVSPPED